MSTLRFPAFNPVTIPISHCAPSPHATGSQLENVSALMVEGALPREETSVRATTAVHEVHQLLATYLLSKWQ